jgi:DNA modification methylase
VGNLVLKSRHRLLCGDSTVRDDVDRVTDGRYFSLCLTDPPYSVNYDKSHQQRGGDAAVHSAYNEADIDPTDLLAFMEYVPSDVMVWSYPIDRHFFALADAYRKYGWTIRKELVWVKDTFSFWMSAKYQQKHEPIMWATRNGKPMGGAIPANATTVMEHARPKAHDLHPTAKPIDLWATLLKNHTAQGDNVFEPFGGSGTTLVAAESLGRQCCCIELSPQYCDVIVDRWESQTGMRAVRRGTD